MTARTPPPRERKIPKLEPEPESAREPEAPTATPAKATKGGNAGKGGKARAKLPRKKLLSPSSRRVAKERREKERGTDS